MALPSFYEKGTGTKVLDSIAKERDERISRQKNLSPESRKALFNQLSLEDKKNCLVDTKRNQPVTPGDVENLWYSKVGRILSPNELAKIKQETSNYTTSARYYSWIRKGDTLLFREFDDKFRETNKNYCQALEKNDLMILVKGESFLKDKGFVTFTSFINSKKDGIK